MTPHKFQEMAGYCFNDDWSGTIQLRDSAEPCPLKTFLQERPGWSPPPKALALPEAGAPFAVPIPVQGIKQTWSPR